VLGVSAALCSCTLTLGQHQPSAEAVTRLRDSGITSLSVGSFALATGSKADLDTHVSSRGSRANPPNGWTFSRYLQESLTSDLKAAGLYDAASALSVRGQLLDGSLDTGVSTGSASLAARFQVVRGDETLFDKTLKDSHTWESSFIGPVAIPRAFDEYVTSFTNVLQALYSDADFRKACAAAPP